MGFPGWVCQYQCPHPNTQVSTVSQSYFWPWCSRLVEAQNSNFSNILLSLYFFQCHVWMWEFDHKEGWAPKNWYFLIVVLEMTLESPLDRKIKPVNPKGNQPRLVTGRTDAETEVSIFWLMRCKELAHWKRPWCWEGLKAKGEECGRRWDY